ncbi:hypothetical protein GUJ93_ZPchr0007g3825 [Zizania palustris]|uniref:Uncharacterized protein n=1 Tax=Zizania palustris TaxID=103762 RepID=A0A8J5SN72_ZIZPA|nr:hypothetical protein GUJ93_ZPchr0007g3825 [Zizania palustris]
MLMPEPKQNEMAVEKTTPTSGPTPARSAVRSFCKTPTASDTSPHGGFSVLRRHVDECLPPLDMTQSPPTQELVAKDLHGMDWWFRHIFREERMSAAHLLDRLVKVRSDSYGPSDYAPSLISDVKNEMTMNGDESKVRTRAHVEVTVGEVCISLSRRRALRLPLPPASPASSSPAGEPCALPFPPEIPARSLSHRRALRAPSPAGEVCALHLPPATSARSISRRRRLRAPSPAGDICMLPLPASTCGAERR